jgi:hypothetical protein
VLEFLNAGRLSARGVRAPVSAITEPEAFVAKLDLRWA